MSEAIFGLIGVLVGALVTGLFDFGLQKRKEQRGQRVARRMLTLELVEARDFLQESLDAGHWTDEPVRVLSNEQWAEHRGVWGTIDDDAQWQAVSRGFMAAAEVRRKNREAPAGTRLDPGDERTEHVEARLPAIEQAIASISDSA